ncbi:TlpA disulfide reductase family protein [Sphingobacterium sp. UT-1RO-CII-1]|uniref:TlpA family protein disulfide reductase n=1 Tax=Sphingobacterium sp. UT-1RO-CII-1 TaxID=2995225 RepID=UPI00227D47CD|nr:TlpA disulfide reductase family protein [Sphingobacterium sp. UT-1RO-CII-1]MCY4781049.1 TlpA disulfide reductase family protein [Sphingobacterium sp. UT-1RO-CII-1]
MMRFLRKGDCYALSKPIKNRYYLFLNSFQCLLLSLSTIYYQFSCNVQKSRARGTTGYGVERDSRVRGVVKERLLRIARRDGRRSAAVLSTIFCVLFSFASVMEAQAQKPRQGGATGSKNAELAVPEAGVVLGDRLPEAFWMQELLLTNDPLGREKLELSDFKDKLLILDFFNTACRPCIASIDIWNALQKEFKSDVAVLAVHLYGDNKLVSAFADKRGWELPIAVGNKADTLINQLFYAHRSFGQVWIMDGQLLAIPKHKDVNAELVRKALMRKPLDIEMNDYYTYFDKTLN